MTQIKGSLGIGGWFRCCWDSQRLAAMDTELAATWVFGSAMRAWGRHEKTLLGNGWTDIYRTDAMSNGSPYDDENRTQIFADAPQIDADVRHAERREGAMPALRNRRASSERSER